MVLFFASSHDVVFVAEEAIESSFSVVGERQVKSSRQKSGTKKLETGDEIVFHPRSRHIIAVWFDIFLTIKSFYREEVKGETQQCGTTTLQLTCLEEPTPKRSSFNRCCHHQAVGHI